MSALEQLISSLKLEPLAEGGHFQRIYQSNKTDDKQRRYGAAIYYLLKAPEFSCFHRIDCDELWHFYVGQPLRLYQIDKAGTLTQTLLGNPMITPGAKPVAIIDSGHWFAAEIVDNKEFSLIGCTTAPEFTFETYEIGDAGRLCKAYPQHTALIRRLTLSN